MKKYFAVSDIHSYYKELLDALDKKGFDANNKEHVVIICGDAFDRGYESKELYEWIVKLIEEDRLIYVRGNHEDLMLDLISSINTHENIGFHHISNGTLSTLSCLMGCTHYDILNESFQRKDFEEVTSKFINLIEKHTVNYFELGKTVFVHGWVPITAYDDGHACVHENWRDGDWEYARWENGLEMFHSNIVPPDKEIIVCGHYHTSFAWSQYEKKCSEWDEDAIFDSYIKYNKDCKHVIVAIDGCTAYTGQVNCVVFNEAGNIV